MVKKEQNRMDKVFVFVIIIVFIGLGIGFYFGWKKINKTGFLSSCLGNKGGWSSDMKTLVQNLIIQKGNQNQYPVPEECFQCIMDKTEKDYDPYKFIMDFNGGLLDSDLKDCSCSN